MRTVRSETSCSAPLEAVIPIDVLVVDDHQMAREWTAGMLARLPGIGTVATASDGAAAYRALAETTPACVVLDVRLPDCSGLDIARHLRALKPSVGIVALTGHEEPAYRAAFARLGVQQYLTKAASAEEIEAAVRMEVEAVRATAQVEPAVPAAVRVLIVEDHPLTGEALANAGLDVVGVASSGAHALTLAGRQRPEVVVLDLHLPDMSGHAVAEQLLRRWPKLLIVVLTGLRDSAQARALLRMGVKGYLTKEASPQELVRAIEAVRRGETAVSEASRSENGRPSPSLSEREREVLVLVGQGQTNAEIAAALYVSVKAVEYHLTGLFQRFDVRNRTELARQAFSLGLI